MANQLNDARFRTLRALGYTGATNDMLLAWLKASGASTSKTLTDAWREFLTAAGFTTGARADRWNSYLRALGYPGSSLLDRELAFWSLGLNLVLNGTFTGSAASWTLNAGWTWVADKARATAATSNLNQAIGTLIAGKLYRTEYTISNYTAGTFYAEFGAAPLSTGLPRTANGTYVEYLAAGAAPTNFHIKAVAASGDIDNVIVREVL